MTFSLEELYKRIESRREADPKDSYTASLFRDGTDRMAQKVGEEAVEVVLAAKNPDREALIAETADLWYHLLVLLVAKGITLHEIYAELEARSKK